MSNTLDRVEEYINASRQAIDTLSIATEDDNTKESGLVLEVDENEDRCLITIGEHGSDYAVGCHIYKDKYSNLPLMFFGGGDQSPFKIGDRVEVLGFGEPTGIRSLKVNDETWFCYTDKQIEAIFKIRQNQKEIKALEEYLSNG